jgi:sugar lactone lactonase YvrE
LRKPTSVTTDPSGLKLVHTTFYDPRTGNVTETRAPAEGGSQPGAYAYSSQLSKLTEACTPVVMRKPGGVAVDSAGHVWVADTWNSRVDEFSNTGEYINRFGTEGTGEGQFKEPEGIAVDSKGDVWVADTGNSRVEELSSTGTFIGMFGEGGAQTGQLAAPAALAIDSSGNVWVADTGNKRVEEFSSKGEYLRELTETAKDEGIVADAKGDVWVSETGNNKVVELSSAAKEIGSFGSFGSGNGQFSAPEGIVISGETAYVVDGGDNRVEEFKLTEKEGKSSGEYVAQFGTKGTGNGQFEGPRGMALDNEGNLWVADTGNNRTQELTRPNPGGPHAAQTIYYTTAANPTYSACGEHPEWASLPCRTQPAAQPAKGVPLPIVSDKMYNIWDEPETVTEECGSTTRTRKLTYDAAGRALTSEETTTGSSDTAVPKVTDEYSSETGVMIKQSTTVGETTKSIKSMYDTLGQLTEYTDADGNPTKYVYAGPANDGQVEEVSYGGKKGSQMYSYDAATKALTKLVDVGPEGGAGAGTFTAGYDIEGKLTSEIYPNAITAKYTYNATGEATGIEYEKTAHCAGTCPEVWFKETVASSIHGEALTRTSTLAKEEYTYDSAVRLSQVNETPKGKGCKTRIYAYNEDSGRTSETTRESASETCATTGGSEEKHTYDEADRLIDAGVEYEAFGNQTKIPEADAEKHAITASFYVDNQIASQKQNGETTNYFYDPAGRTEKTVSEGTTKATVINHYPGSGEAISWTEEEEGKKWTRNIPGIDGALTATQHDSEAAILQLHDLQGDIIATAALSETETKLLTSYNPTEFGVPVNGTPPTKYSWLGASGLATEQATGAANPGGGSYVPQLGAPLQTEPVVPPGALPNGAYGGAVYVTSQSSESTAQGIAYGQGAPGREAARQEAIKKEAEKHAAEGACTLASCTYYGPENLPTPEEGGAEGWEGGYGLEYGDPVGCVVAAHEIQRVEGKPHELNIGGAYGCVAVEMPQDLVGLSIKIELCVEQLVGPLKVDNAVECTRRTYDLLEYPARAIRFTYKCTPGREYRTWIWGWGEGGEPGGWIENGWDEESEPVVC